MITYWWEFSGPSGFGKNPDWRGGESKDAWNCLKKNQNLCRDYSDLIVCGKFKFSDIFKLYIRPFLLTFSFGTTMLAKLKRSPSQVPHLSNSKWVGEPDKGSPRLTRDWFSSWKGERGKAILYLAMKRQKISLNLQNIFPP